MLLVTDLDGTLLDDNKHISDASIHAIEKWVDQGNYFTIATGRTEDTCRLATDLLPVNTPVILYNGASLYDIKERRPVWDRTLDFSGFRGLLTRLQEQIPEVCVEIFCYGPIRLTNPRAIMDPYIIREKQPYMEDSLERIPDRCLKIMLSAEKELLQRAVKDMKLDQLTGCSHFYSADVYYEILPENCTKQTAVEKLADLLKIGQDQVAAAGDHMNDIELLSWAGHSYCPANANSETKKHAKVLKNTNNGQMISEIITELLENEV